MGESKKSIMALLDQKDWKGRYQASIRELDKKEIEWRNVDSLLRKAISRLAIASKGQDQQVNKQLDLIRSLSNKNNDQQLELALNKLANLLKNIDSLQNSSSQSQQQRSEGASTHLDIIKVLIHLFQKISFPENVGSQVRIMCESMLREAVKGESKTALSDFVKYLTKLIDENNIVIQQISNKSQSMMQFLNLLQLDAETTESVKQLNLSNGFNQDELKKLADLINADNQKHNTSAEKIITTLLEQLIVIPELEIQCKKIRQKLSVSDTQQTWPDLLKQIVTAVSSAIKKHRQDKQALSKFIKHISRELSGVNSAIGEQHAEELDVFEDITELGIMMKKSVKAFQQDILQEDNIDQLKNLIEKNIDAIKHGIDDFVDRSSERHASTGDRNSNLMNRLNKMEKETEVLKQKLAENQDKLLHDSLTGLYSRLAYDEYLTQELQRWNRYQNIFSYAILDIDYFKRVNDRYGHNTGDNALKIVSQILKNKTRESDRLFRIGGEEFVLILPNQGQQKAAEIVEELRALVSKSPFHFKQEIVNLTLSVGLTEVRTNDTSESLYERADKALYEAKNTGRNRMVVAD